jgi:hypothetical protein
MQAGPAVMSTDYRPGVGIGVVLGGGFEDLVGGDE